MTISRVTNKSFLSKLLIYGIGGIGAKFIILFLFPIYSFYLTLEELGFYDLVMMTCFIFAPIATLQIGEAAYKFILEGTCDKEKVIVNVYFFCLISFSLLSIITLVILYLLSVNYKIELIGLFVTTAVLQVVRNLARGIGSSKCYAISGVVFSLVLIILNAICLFVFNLGLYSVIISSVFATLVSLSVVLLRNKSLRKINLNLIEFKLIKELLKFSLPLVPNYLSWWAINASNRFIITLILGVASNGVFAMASKIAAIIFALNSIFSLAWQDQVLLEHKKHTSLSYKTPLSNLIVIQTLLVIFLSYMSEYIFDYFINAEYQSAVILIPILCVSAFLSSVSSFYGAIMIKHDKTKDIFKTSFYSGVVCIISVYIFVTIFGLIGAAAGIVLGFALMTVYRAIIMKEFVIVPKLVVFLSLLVVFLLLLFKANQVRSLELMLFLITLSYTCFHFKVAISIFFRKIRGV